MSDPAPTDDSGIELAYASLAVFADAGKLDLAELNLLFVRALRCGSMSESEKAVLRGVFNRVLEADVPADVWKRIQAVRAQHVI